MGFIGAVHFILNKYDICAYNYNVQKYKQT